MTTLNKVRKITEKNVEPKRGPKIRHRPSLGQTSRPATTVPIKTYNGEAVKAGRSNNDFPSSSTNRNGTICTDAPTPDTPRNGLTLALNSVDKPLTATNTGSGTTLTKKIASLGVPKCWLSLDVLSYRTDPT